MTNFTAARINMVDSQIHTMGVVSEPILNAFRTIQREEFVADDRRGVAYNDEDMPIGSGRWLMEPVTHARLVQAALPTETDKVLDVGCATGYSTAILSRLASSVVAVEPDAALLARAEAIWKKHGYTNIIAKNASFDEGSAQQGPFSLIFVNGSVAEIPKALFDQLAPHGRLIGVVRKENDKIGHATLFLKSATGEISHRALFDAALPYLPGQEPRRGFVF